jgi:hypothetical protein
MSFSAIWRAFVRCLFIRENEHRILDLRGTTRREYVNPTQKTARIAGALYLLSAATAGVPLIYAPNALIVDGDAAATAHNILASERIFRCCIVSELIGAVVFIFVARALYRLMSGVNKTYASLMVILVLVSVPITFLNVLNEIAALTLMHGSSFLSVFDSSQRDALAMLFLGLHTDGANVANIFWGLWLFPFGVLVMRSGFLPRILGAWLIANGVALVSVSLVGLLLPDHLNAVNRVAILPELGELWIMAWLLIKGVRVAPAST